jgi:hypothetical protein
VRAGERREREEEREAAKSALYDILTLVLLFLAVRAWDEERPTFLENDGPPSPLSSPSFAELVEMPAATMELYALPGSITHDFPTLDPQSLTAASYLQLLHPGEWALVECSDASQSPSGPSPISPASLVLSSLTFSRFSGRRFLPFSQARRRDLHWLSHPQSPPSD